MDCKYSYRETIGESRNYIRCQLINERCPLTRYCGIVRDIIHTDNYAKKCNRYINKEDSMTLNKETPNKVLFEKRDKLYIEVNDEIGQVVAIQNPFDYLPKAVKLIKKQNGEYSIFIKKETQPNEKKRN